MITAEEAQQIHHIRLPVRYSVLSRIHGLRLSCVDAPKSTATFTLRPYRSRGPRFRRLIAEGGDGLSIGVLLGAGDPKVFADAGAAAVIFAREWALEGDTLDVSDGAYLRATDDIAVAEGLRVWARRAWRRGIAYVQELAAEGDLSARPGLRSPQVGALHAIAAHCAEPGHRNRRHADWHGQDRSHDGCGRRFLWGADSRRCPH